MPLTSSVMNQMTTSYRNFIGPLRVQFPKNILEKGLKCLRQVQRTDQSEKKILRLGAFKNDVISVHNLAVKQLPRGLLLHLSFEQFNKVILQVRLSVKRRLLVKYFVFTKTQSFRSNYHNLLGFNPSNQGLNDSSPNLHWKTTN